MRNLLLALSLILLISLISNLQAQTCRTPQNITVNGLSTSSATIIWDLSATGDVPSSYFFRLSSSGVTLLTDSNLVAPTLSHTLSGLSANTNYTVEISSDCNATSSGISQMVSFSFTTPCDPIPAPFTGNFDSALPSCTFSSNATWSNGGRSGKCVALTSSASQIAYFVFPAVSIPSDNVEISVWLKPSSVLSGNIPLQIGIVTDPSDIEGSFEPLLTDSLTSTTWNEFRMNTSATSLPVASSTMMAVVIPQGFDCITYLDDVTIHTIPSCIRPENLSVSSVTSSSATFSWSATNASSVRIYVSSSLDNHTVLANSNPYTLTSLLPNTDYSFQIRAICSPTDSSDLNPTILTAHTECATADSALFLQDFESLSVANSIPDCWKEGWLLKPQDNTRVFPFSPTSDHAHSGSRSMALLQQPAGSVSFLSSGAIPVDQSGRYTLSVWVYRQEASSFPAEGLRFWASPSASDTTGATLLGFIPRHYLATPVEHTANQWYNYEFVINTSGTRYILVEGISQNGAPLCFDDIAVRLTPSCLRVTNIQTGTPSFCSIPLSWTPGGSEQQWIVSYSLNDGPSVSDTVSSPALTIQSLTSATAYSIEGTVTALCGPGDISDPVSFNASFVTSCQPLSFLPYSCGFEAAELAPVANPLPLCWTRFNDASGADNNHPLASTSYAYSHSGTGYLKFIPVTSSTDYGEHQVAILPEINTSIYPIDTLRLVFYAQATTINPAPVLTVGVMSDPTDLSTFVATDSFTVGTTGYLRYEARFTGYSGGGSFIAMMARRVNTSFLSLNVDDIRLEPIPACSDLTGYGAIVSDITDSRATVSVSDLTASTWSIAYGIEGTPLSSCTVIDTLSASSVILSGLSPQTSYVVYARRRCGSLFGSWSPAVTFRTACGAVSAPYSDSFESYPAKQLQGCYYVVTDEYYLNVFSEPSGSSYNHTTGGSKGLSISNDYSSSYSTLMNGSATVALFVHLEAGRNYELSVYARANNYRNYNISFLTGLSTSALNVLAVSEVNTSTWALHHAYFSPTATGDYYIGFRTSTTNFSSQYSPYLDDISIHEVACIPPSDALLSNLGSSSATIRFTASSPAYDVAVSSSPISITGSVTGDVFRDTISVDSLALSSLSPNTTYYYTIRSICQSGQASEWMTPLSFHTRCITAGVPYSEGFETSSSVSCFIPFSGIGAVARETSIRNSGASSMCVTSSTVVSPEFDVTSFAPYMLNGWAYSSTDSAVFSIGVITDPDDLSSLEIISEVTLSPANTWIEFASYFNILTDPEYAESYDARYFVFATGTNSILFDDLTLDLSPTCNRPTQGIVSSITSHDVTVDWTENGTATSWRLYAVNPYGVEVSQVVSSHPAVLSGLDASTHYSLFVRAICSVTDTSLAYKIGEFSTVCDFVTAPYTENFESFTIGTTPDCWDISSSTHTYTYDHYIDRLWGVYSYGGNKSIRLHNAMCSSGNAIIITPEIILPENLLCDFQYDYCHQANSGPLFVGIRRRGYTNFTTIATLNSSTSSNDDDVPARFITGSHNLQAYAGDTVQFMFYNITNFSQGSIWIDNVKVRTLSDCSEISAITVQNVSDSSVTVAFTDTASSHTSWQYAVVLQGHDVSTATPVTVSSKFLTISGLSASTAYDVYVRAICPPSGFSPWISVSTRTIALPAVLPYVSGFSDPAQNSEWLSLGGGANSFTFGNDPNALFATGSNALYVSNGNSYTYNSSVSSITGMARLFSFGNTSYSIEFDWKCPGGENVSDFGRFYLAPASSDLLPSYSGVAIYRNYSWPDNIIPLDGGNAVNLVEGGAQHTSEIVDMTGRSGLYYLVFVWANDASSGLTSYPLSVGNLSVSELTCEPLTDLTVDPASITFNSATASFSDPNTGASVRWAVSTSALITDSVVSGVASGSSISVSGLSPSTVYHLFARAECSGLDRSPWISTSFTTACAPVSSFPFTESFEGTLFPPVCWTITSLSSVTDQYGTTYGSWEQATRNTHSGSKSATIVTQQGTASLLATPAFALSADREYHVSFWFIQSGSSWNDDEMNLYVGPDATSKSSATLLAHYVAYNSSQSGNSLVKFDVDLPLGLSGDYYIMFEGIDVTNGYIYLDDITVDIYPVCRDFTTTPSVVATTASTATVSIPVGNHTGVRFGIAPYSASPQPSSITSYQFSSTGTAVFTGLTPGTAYSVFARGLCSDGDSTVWTSATAVYTKANDCFAPENIHAVGDISDTAATIAWNPVPNAASFLCILSHGSSPDTVVTTAPQVHLAPLSPNTDYTLMIRGLCGATDSTDWSTFSFRTLRTPANVPYTTGFETSDDNSSWQKITSGYSNNFIIGRDSEGHCTGSRGLFISSDGRSLSQSVPTNPTPQYGVALYGVAYYTRTIYFPAAGNYEVSFDWRCNPVTGGLTYEAYGRAFLAPATASLPVDDATYLRALPAGSFELGSFLEGSASWQHSASIISIDGPRYLNLVFMYISINSTGYASAEDASDTPLAVDNVAVTEISCLPVSSISSIEILDSIGSFVVTQPEPLPIQYTFSTTFTPDTTSLVTLSNTSLKDTIFLTGLTASTDYNLFVRQMCDSSNLSSWRILSFRTTATPAPLPYICGFEDEEENGNWVFTHNQTNAFTIGTATSFGGTHSLYVSNDGSSFNYDVTSHSFAYAHRLMNLPAGLYEFSYDWVCNGEDNDDGARFFIIPADVTLYPGSWLRGLYYYATPQNAIALDEGGLLHGTSAYTSRSGSFTITEPKLYNLVVAWRNSTGGGSNPPVSIDNIHISRVTCIPPVISLINGSLTLDSAAFVVANVNEDASLVVALSSSADVADAFAVDTLAFSAVDTLSFAGLSPSSSYHLFARALCDSADLSFWSSLRFQTLCGTVNAYPYSEGFEYVATSNGYVADALSSICWSSLNASSAKPYYNFTSSQHSEGSNSLRLTSSNTVPLYILLPEMDDLSNLLLSFSALFDDSSAAAGTLTAGYLTAPADTSSFVSVQTFSPVSSWSLLTALYISAPDGARMALRYSGATSSSYNLYIDDVRVSRLVDGPVYYDTICNNANYMLHGFSVDNADIASGDNTFTRIDRSAVQGSHDTLVTAHLFRLADKVSVTYDTVCGGQPYVHGLWSIDDPVTRAYTQTFRGASACGCDTTVTLNLTVIPTSHVISDTICFGGSYTFRDTVITTPGLHTRSYTTTYGCTAVDSLYLMVLPDSVFDVATVCQNDLPYIWHGQNISTAGRHCLQIAGPRLCPQIAILDLTVISTDSTINVAICQGGSVQVVDTLISTAGTHLIRRIEPLGGCWVNYHVNATITPAVPVDVHDFVCEGTTYTGHGIHNLPVTADTVVQVSTRTADSRCDSITNVHISFIPTVYKDIYATINKGESYRFNGTDYTETGDYPATFHTVETNCDSNVTLHLTVLTALDIVSDLHIDVIPNPARTGQPVTLHIGNPDEIDHIDLITPLGRHILSISPSDATFTLNTSSLYLLRITLRNGQTVLRKLIVR